MNEVTPNLSYIEEHVPIEKLRVDEEFKSLVPPNNMREQLASSLAKNGQTLPIDVDSDYIILDGYTRFEIMKELKYKEIKVRRWNFKSSENRAIAYKVIAMLNLQRRHLEKNEVLKLLRELSEKIDQSQNEKNEEEPAESTEATQKPADLEKKMVQIKEEVGAKEVSELDIHRYSLISSIPFLRQLVDDGKISLRIAYELYTKAKDKLQQIANLPKYEREQLVTTKEGRKILLERDDLLQQILDHKIAVSQAISQIKSERKRQKAKKKAEVEEGEEDEDEEDSASESEGEEIDLVKEWRKALEEEKAQQAQAQEKEEVPPTKIEIIMPKPDLSPLYSSVPTIKRLVDDGKLSEKDAEKIYEIWRNMEAIYKQASLLWYNSIDKLLEKVGLSNNDREEIFHEMTKPFCKLFPKEEVFPKEALGGE
ncbi:MAG: ParB N-terminal domain-containing protein [Thermoprotei archaeon]|nr:ParB N-terminal domain-containing protein [Thermoprotei archaeon]